jgi:hypothetical protein
VDKAGRFSLPAVDGDNFVTVAAPGPDPVKANLAKLVQTGQPVILRPWSSSLASRRAAFVCDLVVAPDADLPAASLKGLAARAHAAETAALGPHYGSSLEKQAELWPDLPGWKLTPGGLLITGGDVGLMNGQGYKDYRLDFDLRLPADGQGITGWIVRARDPDNCIMFQIQSADSPFAMPEFKTKPNTLRPHTRINGQWTVLTPISLPNPIRRGETHHITTECLGDRIRVLVDGKLAADLTMKGFADGSVGFRANSPDEQGLFTNISLTQERAAGRKSGP